MKTVLDCRNNTFSIAIRVTYSAYYFRKSAELVKNEYVGRYEFGEKKNKEFKLFFGDDVLGLEFGLRAWKQMLADELRSIWPVINL